MAEVRACAKSRPLWTIQGIMEEGKFRETARGTCVSVFRAKEQMLAMRARGQMTSYLLRTRHFWGIQKLKQSLQRLALFFHVVVSVVMTCLHSRDAMRL